MCEDEGSDRDIFDTLPKHLVSHILSRLTTKEAIRTSVLAKRWRFSWTTISNLDFSDYSIPNRKAIIEGGGVRFIKFKDDLKYKRYTDYVNKVLLQLQTTSLQEFSLILHNHRDRLHLNEWISAAIKLNVKYLRLNLSKFRKDPVIVPGQLFDFKSIESLVLQEGAFFNIPEKGYFFKLKVLRLTWLKICEIPAQENSPCFPKLETLHLGYVEFVGQDNCVMKFIRQCPVLKSFTIARRVDKDASNIDLRIPQLERAQLDFHLDDVGCKVEIQARVKYLKLVRVNPTLKILVRYPDSLNEVDVRIDTIPYDDTKPAYHFQGEQRDEVFKLMNSFQKVKSLNLRAKTPDAIKTSNIKLPLFCNLTQLSLYFDGNNVCVIRTFLYNSNNLQFLIVWRETCLGCQTGDEWLTEFSDVPQCFLTSFKRVVINNSNGCSCEVDLVKNILKWGKMLTKVVASSSVLEDEEVILLDQKLSAFPRASASCEVDFKKTILKRRNDVQAAISIESKWSFHC
jgi:hypothetical protein